MTGSERGGTGSDRVGTGPEELAALPQEAFAAALAGLPHLTPARLRWLMAGQSPAQAWARVAEGEATRAWPRARQGAVRAGLPPPAWSGQDKGGPETDGPGDGPEADGPEDGDLGLGSDDGAPGTGLGRRAGWTPARLARAWADHARGLDPVRLWSAYRAAGIEVRLLGDPRYPSAIGQDPSAPAVLFSLGSLASLERPRVAVIGTRSATHYGEEIAAELGLELARAGVSVVSGLALGIDGAAHAGALAGRGAPPLAVVGSGLNVVYPPAHSRLWARMAATAGLISESPLGAPAQAWRFPWRNRLLAALADVVVVVESHRGGGSLLTAEAAARRAIPVMAVPGSIRSPASEGTNALLADGCAPARDVEDVLAALGLSSPGGVRRPCRSQSPPPGRDGEDGAVWRALEAQPTPTETVLARTGLSLGRAAAALDRLEEGGWARSGPGWWERQYGR